MASTYPDLTNNHALWWRIHVFVFDLRNLRDRDSSHRRLDSITDASYLGSPFFSDEGVAQLKASAVEATGKSWDTLDERLERRMKKRVESEDFRGCAAHDLAPIFEAAFQINPRNLARNDRFLRLVDEYGLEASENWTEVLAKPRCGPKPWPGKEKK